MGGTSAINLNLLAYPSKSDLDGWEKLGNSGWNWDNMQPYYRKFHTLMPPSKEVREVLQMGYLDDAAQGISGPIQASFGDSPGPMDKAWPQTFRNLSLAMSGDHLSGVATGGHSNPATIDAKSRTRSHAGSSYYSAEIAHRPNLRVLTEALVEKVVLQESNNDLTATGVQFITTQDGSRRTINASKEVILCAGSLLSPQILELSGIGDPTLLRSHNIELLVPNPNVGENLQDHQVAHLSFEVNDDIPTADAFRDLAVVQAAMSLYQSSRTGPFAGGTYSSAFTSTPAFMSPDGQSDLQTLLAAHPPITDQERLLHDLLLATGDSSSAQYFLGPFQINVGAGHLPSQFLAPTLPGNYLTLLVTVSHPFSRGSVHIASSDPREKPTLDPRYLSHPLDLEILARQTQFFDTIASTPPWSSLLKPDGRRIPAGVDLSDLKQAKGLARQMITNFHPVGTCPMGSREKGGVVDERLRVHGVKGLRVVDASVFPLIMRGNVVSSVYAVAERAAEMVREDWAGVGKGVGEGKGYVGTETGRGMVGA